MRPERIFSSVVLPAPFAPISPLKEPGSIEKLTPLRASCSTYLGLTSRPRAPFRPSSFLTERNERRTSLTSITGGPLINHLARARELNAGHAFDESVVAGLHGLSFSEVFGLGHEIDECLIDRECRDQDFASVGQIDDRVDQKMRILLRMKERDEIRAQDATLRTFPMESFASTVSSARDRGELREVEITDLRREVLGSLAQDFDPLFVVSERDAAAK